LSINLVATDASKFLSCTQKYAFEKSKSFTTISKNNINYKTTIGNFIHFVLEKFFYQNLKNIDNEFIEKFYSIFLEEKNKNEVLDINFLSTIQGIKTISMIKKMVESIYKIEGIDDYNFLPEQYYNAQPFGGQLDLVLESASKVIVIDYKTGNITNKVGTEILESIVNQFRIYQILIQDEFPNKKLEFFILDKDGILTKVDYDKIETDEFKEKMVNSIIEFDKNNYIFGNEDTCFSCNYSAFCENYTSSDLNINIESAKNIQCVVTSVKEELNTQIVKLRGLEGAHKDIDIKLVIDFQEKNNLLLQPDMKINVNYPNFLGQNNNVNVFKIGFGSLTFQNP
tara:strand:- start:589 stop:1608 length:1020 start_codon:yes stop_codon:yes gene_type:complete